MDIRLLEYFIAVCEELHFTKAAERLGISQPTMSQQIRLLEDRMGISLFQRIGKKVYITEAGHILLNHTRRIFYELKQVDNEINELRGLQRGKLTIGCSGNHLLLPSIVTFHEKYPQIELSIMNASTEETKEGILNNQVDIGIIFLPIDDHQLESKPLFREKLFLVVSDEHEWADTSYIKLEDLQSKPIFLLQKKYLIRQFIDQHCQEAGFKLKPVVELSDSESLFRMTLLNKGATILPKSYLDNVSNPNIRIIPIADLDIQKEIGVIYRKETNHDSTIGVFIDHLIKNYKVKS